MIIATFDRIGRNHYVPPLAVTGTPDEIAEQVFRYARRYLGSKWYEVTVDLETMTGAIEYGRFGSFMLQETEESMP